MNTNGKSLIRRSLSTLACLAALALTPAALADVFTGDIDNNWFDAGNWSGGVVPTPVIDAEIQGGFDVTALLADSGGDSVQCNDMEIGWYDGPGVATLTSEVAIDVGCLEVGGARFDKGDFSGRLEVNGADVTTIEFYVAYNSSNPLDSTDGAVVITDGSLIFDCYGAIGWIFQGGGDATGYVSVTNGNITGNGEADIEIGYSIQTSPGHAEGTLRLENGTASGMGEVVLGYVSSSNPDSSASGTLILISSEMTLVSELYVAGASTGTATGLVVLDGSLLAIGPGSLYLHDGATTEFHVDGTNRVSTGDVGGPGRYAAIDYLGGGDAEISGDSDVEVHFGYTPADGDSFDLITLAVGEVFGGDGDFDEVRYVDLDPGFAASYEIVAGTGTSGEIFRVTVCLGDLDADGQNDLVDYAILAGCMDGPDQPLADGCDATDFDGDGDADLADFAMFQAAFGCP